MKNVSENYELTLTYKLEIFMLGMELLIRFHYHLHTGIFFQSEQDYANGK